MILEKYPYTILYVEDEKEIRSNYVRYLNRYYETVYEAEDGEKAYKIYLENKPEILIIDINVPKLNGIELLKKIREHDHTTKVIMLTARRDIELLLEISSLKLTKYLVKPVTRDALKSALDEALKELSKFDTRSKKQILLREKFIYNFENQELLQDSVSVSLTQKELLIFHTLISYPNKIFTYDEFIYEVWGCTEGNKYDALRTLIKQLRKKLPKDTIQNMSGIGYKIDI